MATPPPHDDPAGARPSRRLVRTGRTPTPPRKRRTEPPPPDDPAAAIPLDDTERLFVEEYLRDRNATQAYRRVRPEVSYSSAGQLGADMRRRPHVAAEIDAALRAQRLRVRVSADAVLAEIARVAFADVYELYDTQTGQLRNPRHVPYETRKAIMAVRVSRVRTTRRTEGQTTTTVSDTIMEYRFHPKMEALGKLARHLGLDTEITPLDALLRALPTDLADQVREHLVAPPPARGKPPRTTARTNAPYGHAAG